MRDCGEQEYGELIEDLLDRVQKPARYAGGEWNSVTKDWEKTAVRLAFAFPDLYEVGMSHLGLQILYDTVNRRQDALMERVFAPWGDMEGLMRDRGLTLFTLESRKPVKDFDIVAFTLQYEMSFTNIINMLDLAGIPVRSSERGPGFPLVIAGGPCAFNPEPLAGFIDAFAIGEGEELLHDLIDFIKEHKDRPRDFLLRGLAGIPGVYVPRFYAVSYEENGAIQSVTPETGEIPEKVTKRVVTDYDRVTFPVRPIVPSMGVVHDRAMLEVLRGCTRGCRFCQAGAIYRPVREKSPGTLLDQAKEIVQSTGCDEISLTSLSSADYSGINQLVKSLLDRMDGQGVGVSLPSLRVDAFSVDLAREVQRVRRSSLTFAPEAGTQRLRDVINKGVTEENLLEAVSAAFGAGWQSVKLYFMIGLPTETREDIDGIALLAGKALKKGEAMGVKRGRLKVTVSVSSFVPKSHTPFQWVPQDTLDEISSKQQYLKSILRDKRISFKWHDPFLSFLEGVLARGDRRLAAVLEGAWRNGSRFDGWSECFDYERWQAAFNDAGIDPAWYTYRRRDYDEVLPWDHIDAGIGRKYLINEHRRAMEARPTVDCRRGKCPGCGVCDHLGAAIELKGGDGCAPLQDQV